MIDIFLVLHKIWIHFDLNIYKIVLKGAKLFYMGIPDKETADLLAKDSISNTSSTPIKEITLLDAVTWLKSTIRKKLITYWKEWNTYHPTTMLFYTPTLQNNHWHDNMHFGRNTYTSLVRLMFNHECFPSHLFKIGIYDSPMCIYCNLDEGTANHLIFNCTKFKKESTKLLNYLFDSGLTSPFNITNLLASEEKEILPRVAFFS